MHARALAAAQTTPACGDVDANVEQHVRLVRVAAEERAEVVVFPELSLTGYELDLANDLAFSENDPRLAPLIEAATSRSMILIVGAPARIGTRLYLGAFIISPSGGVEIYTKHHLGAFSANDNPGGSVPPPEATVFHAGEQNPLIQFGSSTAAVAVCADTGRPSHAKNAADRGATTYLASMFVIPAHLQNDTRNLETYAVRHSMAVVFSNFGGRSGGLPSGGKSAIWSEKGKRLTQLEASGAGVAIAIEDDAGWRGKAVTLAEH